MHPPLKIPRLLLRADIPLFEHARPQAAACVVAHLQRNSQVAMRQVQVAMRQVLVAMRQVLVAMQQVLVAMRPGPAAMLTQLRDAAGCTQGMWPTWLRASNFLLGCELKPAPLLEVMGRDGCGAAGGAGIRAKA